MINMNRKPPKNPIKFTLELSKEQKDAKALILQRPYNFVLGEAGSGKTLLAVQIALDAYFTNKINKIVITRPEASEEKAPFLPGTQEEKMEPWLIPIRSNMRKVYNKADKLEKMEKEKSIEIVSLTHFRGRTFENCICIVDEFQNLTKSQLKKVIGRLGKNSTMIFSGDPGQIDIPEDSSAAGEIHKLKGSKHVNVIELLDNHRHPAMRDVLRILYRKP